MEQYKNLLQSISSVFNETAGNKNCDIDINNDRTLKWKTLHHNQYASKKDGKKMKSSANNEFVTANINDALKTEGNIDIKQENYEDESWDSNSSTSVDFKKKHKREKKIESRDKKFLRKSNRKRKSSNFQKVSELRLRSVTHRNKKQDKIVSSTSIMNNNIVLSSPQSDEEVFHSFGKTIALQLKELNKFSKIEAHKTIQEIQNLVATRIVKILAQVEDQSINNSSKP
ncbi:uncharacterized protein LOC129618411 [Condylostylus longicornis]|uniref:uncharacterized protein LOC129618411 n=1 Tax=Condylostylus longicornis TaxID=2530218 RepID=UPI00244DAF30|nr:uncharacterized protein LOC129618411 [Condylostylus longicornis]